MIPRDETMGVCKRLSELRNFVYWSPKCICHVYSRSFMTEKSRENQKVYLFLQESKLDKLFLCKLFMLTKKIWGFLCRIFLFFFKKHYIFPFTQQKGCMRLCHTAINHQWGFGSKALQRFKLLPSHNSSILFDSITCHLGRQRTHYGGLFLMQTYTYVYACTHATCTHTHTQMWTHMPRDDTIVLTVARCCCNLWRDRVAGLASHQCLPTRWWAFSLTGL